MSALTYSAIGIEALSSTQPNPIDLVWNEAVAAFSRPSPPMSPARVHAVEYAGESHVQKLKNIQLKMSQKGADLMVISALDEVCMMEL